VGGSPTVAARIAAALAAANTHPHVPLLSEARAKEYSLEERFEKAGIPIELLNKAGAAGFADQEPW